MVYLTVVIYPTVVQGVFINPAFIEPFGLTLIEVLFLELYIKKKNCDCLFFTQSSNFTLFFFFFGVAEQAAAHGLPIVATKNGGPVDIHRVHSDFPYILVIRDQMKESSKFYICILEPE